MPRHILLLQNEIRDYAWGSHTALAELMGRPSPSAGPEAELWMGAHPGAPSKVSPEGPEIGLDAWIGRHPEAVLGAEVARRFEAELPFLLKVVAPAQALSIQTHPDAQQAREGFARENAAGLALDAPNRNYRDPYHKPEIVCALTPFDALCGFRPIDEIVAGVEALSLAGLHEALAALAADRSRSGLEKFFGGVMTRSAEARTELAEQVAEQAARGSGEPEACRCAVWLAEQYPGDAGVLAPFLLNAVSLEPGEALYLPAGELHCYLRGTAMEAMANSDNVLRGGLTPKHMDVPELLRTLSFNDGHPPVLRPRELVPGLAVYDTPAAEFELALLQPRADRAVRCEGRSSVEVLFCAEGEARLVAGEEAVVLERGCAAMVPAALSTLVVEGDARIFRAGVPR